MSALEKASCLSRIVWKSPPHLVRNIPIADTVSPSIIPLSTACACTTKTQLFDSTRPNPHRIDKLFATAEQLQQQPSEPAHTEQDDGTSEASEGLYGLDLIHIPLYVDPKMPVPPLDIDLIISMMWGRPLVDLIHVMVDTLQHGEEVVRHEFRKFLFGTALSENDLGEDGSGRTSSGSATTTTVQSSRYVTT